MKIGILTSSSTSTPEERAASAFARTLSGHRVILLTPQDILRSAHALRGIDVCWWHHDADVRLPANMLAPSVREHIHQFISNGGSLLLSLLAAPYVCELGIESQSPNRILRGVWKEESWAKEYPDIRGFASFQGHPIFRGLGGGAYTWNPEPGRPFAAALYDDLLPSRGNVVAVERLYIKINDRLRLISEYEAGKGRVLAIGSYLFFAEPPGRFRPHLELFTRNCLEYLGRRRASTSPRTTYWNFSPATVQTVQRTSPSIPWTKPTISTRQSSLAIKRSLDAGTDPGKPFNVGGRRILILGNERSGLEEIWVHPLRILQRVRTSIRFGTDETIPFARLAAHLTIRPDSIQREYECAGTLIRERIAGDRRLPAGIIQYETNSTNACEIRLEAEIDLRLMWPLNEKATGAITNAWDRGLHAAVVASRSGDLCALIGTSLRTNDVGAAFSIPDPKRASVAVDLRLRLKPGPQVVTIAFAGSHIGEADAVAAYRSAIADPGRLVDDHVESTEKLLHQSTRIVSPDPVFNAGYDWAIVSSERFLVETPGVGTSLMAGFGTTARGWDGGQAVSGRPGYAWYFGRDAVWSAFALLDAGRFALVRDVIEFLGQHQDPTGKILHELTSSGFSHYDAADSTPLYLMLVGRYLRATNDVAFIRSQLPAIDRALVFCRSTDTDGDGLIENTNVGHGWVEGGGLFPVHVEHYLASCWAEAQREIAHVYSAFRRVAEATRLVHDAKKAAEQLQLRFWNPRKNFFHFALRADGSFNEEQTILPAVGISFGYSTPEQSRPVIEAFASSDFSADWGARIIGRSNPMFKPTGYHYGSVWPLFTGWASLAAFRTGHPVQGFQHVMSNLLLFRPFAAGTIEEVLRGDILEPAGVCSHQAWSETMALQPILEGMCGIEVDAQTNTLRLRPYLPPAWNWMEIKTIHVGKAIVDVRCERLPSGFRFAFSSKGASIRLFLQPRLPLGGVLRSVVVRGKKKKLQASISTYADVPEIGTVLRGRTEIIFTGEEGIAVDPPLPLLVPGTTSSCTRVISEQMAGSAYHLAIERRKGISSILRLFDRTRRFSVNGTDQWIQREGEAIIIRFDAAGETDDGTFTREAIVLVDASHSTSRS